MATDPDIATDEDMLALVGGTLAEIELVAGQIVLSVGFYDKRVCGAVVWHWSCTN
jgi:hypothetical protein